MVIDDIGSCLILYSRYSYKRQASEKVTCK